MVQDNRAEARQDTDHCTRERVILVHGTFASSAEDHGKAWWQIGSPAHEALRGRLPAGVDLCEEGELFRWSGDNTERARSKAAGELLRLVEKHEEAGRPYHLIGHSHGGSVIWAMLRLATAKKRSLETLRSWSTVGTPFLQHRSRSPWSPTNIAYMLMAIVLLQPAWRCLSAIVLLPYGMMTGSMDNGVVIKSDEQVGAFTAMTRMPVLKGLEMAGLPFVPVEDGIRVGSFDPTSGESSAHFLFCTIEGWLILGAIILFGYMTLLLSSFFLSSVSEGMRIAWEKRMEHKAFSRYQERWLGIWTKDDEAINGLRATLELSISFIGNLVVRERIFFSDLFAIPSRPLFKLMAPIYNRIVRPLLDSKIREIVVKTAQGNDRPAAQVVAVSPHPILPPPAESVPPLPDSIGSKITRMADRHANELGPKLRVLLAQPSVTSGLEGFSQTLSGNELVHTSYFDHDEVMDLLSLNIAWSRGRHRPRRATQSPEMARWFADFKRLQQLETEADEPSPPTQKMDHAGSPGENPEDAHAA